MITANTSEWDIAEMVIYALSHIECMITCVITLKEMEPVEMKDASTPMSENPLYASTSCKETVKEATYATITIER